MLNGRLVVYETNQCYTPNLIVSTSSLRALRQILNDNNTSIRTYDVGLVID
jgi:hypothetical protein